MSFSYTIDGPKHPSGKGGRSMRVTGTYTDAASAGSSVVTGLTKVIQCGVTTSSAVSNGCVESGTAGTLTIKAENDGVDDGLWWAEGY